MTFYLAGPYSDREHLRSCASVVAGVSGWTCNARWLDGSHDGMGPNVAAKEDFEDVDSAHALVIDARRQSTRGGMWVEAGIAIAQGKPVVAIVAEPQLPNVFMFLPKVYWAGDETEAGHMLASLGKGAGS